MTRKNADNLVYLLLGVMAGGTIVGTAAITTAAGAFALTGAMLVVWVVTFFVWLFWGSA